MESSISRELQVLSSHTVHHFALIAMTLRMHGVEIDSDFGMAPSTLRYLASKNGGGCIDVHRKLGPATRADIICWRIAMKSAHEVGHLRRQFGSEVACAMSRPIDSDFGGTWIAANQFGVSVCLLNGDAGTTGIRARRSRGLLLRELAWAPSGGECRLMAESARPELPSHRSSC